MAEVIRIDGGAEAPATPSLPQNIEAEAALLGALMIDNRLVEDIQLKLKPLHFFEPLHGRIYEAILRMTDANRVANPVTLKPMFDGDESIKELGGPAYLAQLTGSGAAIIGARDFAAQIYDLALLRALVGVGRDLVEGALDTSEEVAPLAQIERAETELYKVAEEGGAEGKAKSFAEATKEALQMAEGANVGARLDLDAIPRPHGVPIGRWLLTFPSFGFLLAAPEQHAQEAIDAFARRGLACAACGTFDATRTLTLRLGATSELAWDLTQQPLTGLSPSAGA